LHNAVHTQSFISNNNFDLFDYISCTLASFHQQNQHITSTDCITTATSYIQGVAETRQTFRNSAKKCRLYHQEIDSRLFLVVLTVAYSYSFPFSAALWKRGNFNINRRVCGLFCVATKHGIWQRITANLVCLEMGSWIKYLDLRNLVLH